MTNAEIKNDVRAYMGEAYDDEDAEPIKQFLENMLKQYDDAMKRVKKGS